MSVGYFYAFFGEIMTREYDSTYFSADDCLLSGQCFRFQAENGGYFVNSDDKLCFVRTAGDTTFLTCEEEDLPYFENYFDLSVDYGEIYRAAIGQGGALAQAANRAKGVRILRQAPFETLVCFLLSQNNNIPRIKNSVRLLCEKLGRERVCLGKRYFAFPSAADMAEADEDFYRSIGAGYRARYLLSAAKAVHGGEILDENTPLTNFLGVGEKVADCISLFAFHRTEKFPVDTWMEKAYREDFGGSAKNRSDMVAFFEKKFGAYSGYFQQYLFYYKRNLS